MYGNLSPFSLFFRGSQLSLLDYTESGLQQRGSYNKSKLDRLGKYFKTLDYTLHKGGFDSLAKEKYNYILIPNLIHHIPVSEHIQFFEIVKNLLDKDGKLMIFEPAFREIPKPHITTVRTRQKDLVKS